MDTPRQRLKVLRTNEVCEILGISRATLWRWERAGHLPQKRKLGPNVVGWLETEIEAWLAEMSNETKEEASDAAA